MPLFIAQRPEVRQLVTKWSGIDYAQLKVVGNFNLIFNVLALVKRQVGQAFGIEGATAQIRPEGGQIYSAATRSKNQLRTSLATRTKFNPGS